MALYDLNPSRRWHSIAVTVAMAAGCGGEKGGNDAIKKQALEVRDRALACKDQACVSAASAEFVALTRQVKQMSASDLDYFAEIKVDISTAALRFETAPGATPPTAAPPATATTLTRAKAPGFSVQLPAGWETRDMHKPNILLAAAKGDSVAAMTTLIVTRGPQAEAFDTKQACEARGAEQATAVGGVFTRAAMMDLKAGTACVIVVHRDTHDALVMLLPAAKNEVFYAICDGLSADAKHDCPDILSSWQPEP